MKVFVVRGHGDEQHEYKEIEAIFSTRQKAEGYVMVYQYHWMSYSDFTLREGLTIEEWEVE